MLVFFSVGIVWVSYCDCANGLTKVLCHPSADHISSCEHHGLLSTKACLHYWTSFYTVVVCDSARTVLEETLCCSYKWDINFKNFYQFLWDRKHTGQEKKWATIFLYCRKKLKMDGCGSNNLQGRVSDLHHSYMCPTPVPRGLSENFMFIITTLMLSKNWKVWTQQRNYSITCGFSLLLRKMQKTCLMWFI